ncbi:dinitrogenase iron-molybdenum cofactor, partial [Candidatus Bathyarchaeota archaeon]|nr:dinitrogenase iron-molybdenum cofactor [Candidatus Bathyarchaeota archaeon]
MVIPVVDESGLDAQISEHFGRTRFFAVIDLDEKGQVKEQKIVPNSGEHFGGVG